MTKNIVKFIAWADTHWDELGAKCVTIEDTDSVERAIFEKAQKESFDFTLFAGDRFLRRDPKDEVKTKADQVVYDLVHNGTVPYYHLVGNHDFSDNTLTWHTSNSLKMFKNTTVMDEAKTYIGPNVCIHALPADFTYDKNNYSVNPDLFNVFVFHDTVLWSKMNESGSMLFTSGFDLSSVDVPEFDLVLAGDVHIRQPFALKNTRGGYLGSVVQRTKADSNCQRGWTEVIAQKTKKGWVCETQFVPTKNLFTRKVFTVDSNTKFSDLKFDIDEVRDQFVEVKLLGDKKDVDNLANNKGWEDLEKTMFARKIEILRAYESQQSEAVVDLTSSVTVDGDIDLYLKSSFASLGNLKAEDILTVLKNIRKEIQ
jgi:DNA repair exonuclease SbcCD nuclease subunit